MSDAVKAVKRFSHQAALHDSAPHGAAMLSSFLAEGIDLEIPTIVMVGPDLDRAITDALGDRDRALIRMNPRAYQRPLSSLQRELSLDRLFLAQGAREVRMVACVPHPGTGADWSGWVRFEAAVNHFFAALPVTRVCTYPRGGTSRHVLEDVLATHPSLLDDHGRVRPNPMYVEPETLLPEKAEREVDPLEESAPVVELRDASADEARAAVADIASDLPLKRQDVSALCVAADEAVTNARRHGRGTVITRIWRGENRVAVAVSDQGSGPASPFAGMLAGAGRQGMWLLHQLCTRVSTTQGPDGFTVHLVAQANVPRRG